jgi:hypothetical protein
MNKSRTSEFSEADPEVTSTAKKLTILSPNKYLHNNLMQYKHVNIRCVAFTAAKVGTTFSQTFQGLSAL